MRNPWIWFAIYYGFSALVSGMPAPEEKSGQSYKWAYGTLHLLAANASKVYASFRNGKLPQGPIDPKA